MFSENLSMTKAVHCLHLCVVFVAFFLVACTDEGLRKPKGSSSASTPSQNEDYALKVLVDYGDRKEVQHIRPLDLSDSLRMGPDSFGSVLENEPGQGHPGLEEQGASSESSRYRTLANVGKGNSSENTNETDEQNGWAPGWTLLRWAQQSCFDVARPSVGSMANGTADGWGPAAYYVFYNVGQFPPPVFPSCDHILYAQEVLLCMADRLAEVGDSVGTVTWASEDGGQPITVTIPPQATKDRFIARDMALNVLAHLGRLELRRGFARELQRPARQRLSGDAGLLAARGSASTRPNRRWTEALSA